MKNYRILTVLLFSMLFVSALGAQSYKTAVGVRLHDGINVSVQQHLFDKWTVEGILHTSIASNDLGFTVLAERHHKVLFRNLNLYYGAGGHYYPESAASRDRDNVQQNVAGISFIGGAELSLGRINVSVDFKPELHLTGDQVYPFEWNGSAVSVRYILIKRQKERRQIRDWGVWDGIGRGRSKRG